jgi:transposase
MDVTDEQWAVLEPLIPEDEREPGGRGRPWRPARDVFNSILWILKTGARWQDLPAGYPPYQRAIGGSNSGSTVVSSI